MGIAIVTFVALFLFIASAGALLFYREAMMKRLATVLSPRRTSPKPACPGKGGWSVHRRLRRTYREGAAAERGGNINRSHALDQGRLS